MSGTVNTGELLHLEGLNDEAIQKMGYIPPTNQELLERKAATKRVLDDYKKAGAVESEFHISRTPDGTTERILTALHDAFMAGKFEIPIPFQTILDDTGYAAELDSACVVLSAMAQGTASGSSEVKLGRKTGIIETHSKTFPLQIRLPSFTEVTTIKAGHEWFVAKEKFNFLQHLSLEIGSKSLTMDDITDKDRQKIGEDVVFGDYVKLKVNSLPKNPEEIENLRQFGNAFSAGLQKNFADIGQQSSTIFLETGG